MASKIEKYYPEIIGSLLCLALGMLSGVSVQASDSLWYLSLNKPSFNPPAWVFGPAWTVLYIMMGVALGMLWKEKIKNRYLIFIFATQFVFNLLWSPIFFYYQNIGWAFIDICALWLSIVGFMIAARNRRVIKLLFVPYLCWVSFAALLNFSIYKMNIIDSVRTLN